MSDRECEITKQILLSIQCFPCQCAGAIRVRKVPRVFEPREGIIIRHFGPLSSWKTVQCSLFSLYSHLLFKVFVVTLFSGILSIWGILSTLWQLEGDGLVGYLQFQSWSFDVLGKGFTEGRWQHKFSDPLQSILNFLRHGKGLGNRKFSRTFHTENKITTFTKLMVNMNMNELMSSVPLSNAYFLLV